MTGISHVEEHRRHESPFVAVCQCADQTDSGGRQKTRWQDGQHHHHCRCLCDMLTVEGSLRWSGQYGSFGEVRHQTDGFTRLAKNTALAHQPLRYAGQYADSETGLHYNLFRYYDPQNGRFIVQDPIGLDGGWNLYRYAPNPLTWIDPLGLAVDPIAKLEGFGYSGVKKTQGGGLDFADSNALYNKKPDVNPIVKIKYTGDYDLDFQAANKAAGLNQKKAPSGYVWHHLDDYDPRTNTGTMQLVEQGAHRGIPHKGGVSQYKLATGNAYTHPARFRSNKTCP